MENLEAITIKTWFALVMVFFIIVSDSPAKALICAAIACLWLWSLVAGIELNIKAKIRREEFFERWGF